ncbi:MAG: hypothetical protein EBE86_009770 [Hormoscilla sp. GUM202]|nr:hypothetical protein [Hormoscilla sp. GM7CHS1pb]MBO1347654.1 hypothetical protein [Hormoscilla sp. GUM202]
MSKVERKIKLARKFYKKKDWQHSKTGCIFPIASSLQYHNTNWQHLRFKIHQKKALAVARRGMKLKELVPSSITAYLDVKKSGKHVWSLWYQLNKLLKSCTKWKNRHSFYGVSIWGLEVKGMVDPACGKNQTKRKYTFS